MWECGRFGLGTMAHRVPFQDSIRVLTAFWLGLKLPTAVQDRAETQDTPLSESKEPCGALGLGTMVHRVPFQDSMRVLAAAPEAWKFPTAVQDRAETQETALSSLEAPAGPAWGVGTSFQVRPPACPAARGPPRARPAATAGLNDAAKPARTAQATNMVASFACMPASWGAALPRAVPPLNNAQDSSMPTHSSHPADSDHA